ncbi:uncharacterized protein LOC106167535 [Lingula anatina]|uniref:Uncharacterized protein LOC106167535 n=1 Tax=Lingula anatina TaxID=7574 RepID=A0A1S3IW61_LINAN|nr:uncharacterized protein LOC106167535 [Lingula anatina]|eukprot:XP_013401789.1 uncharacterized protein LOC106167535 [Lingula anatina]
MILRTLRSTQWLKDFPKFRISCIFQLQHKMAGTQAGSDNNTKDSPEESNKIFCFELKGGPFYFTLQNASEIGSKRQKFHYPQELQNCKEVLGMSSFAVSTDGKNATNGLHSIKSSVVHNMIRHYSMRDRLKTMENNSSFLMDKRCAVIPTLTLDKNVEGDDRFCRGFAILVNEKGFPEDSVKDAVKEGIAEFDCLSFNRFVNEGDQIVHHPDTGVDNEETSSVVVPVPRPHIHPAFLDRETIGVFHSYERSVRILNEVFKIDIFLDKLLSIKQNIRRCSEN